MALPAAIALGTAIAGTILVAGLTDSAETAALITLAAIALVGLGAAALVPRGMVPSVAHAAVHEAT